ncbi:prepilin-type N-terminal cleavage/methylation domain-containing protein [Pantoea sp. Acro-805]|uniref:Prepilin-type N-terminal cleavage/methylation domain-containing protein n=1 Tax=Candidatus Pantoea formicae TaxID=2608355 RepID=A0ABX0R0R7_9GAMM|nr:prepilin-type N-terminal cleavage/methylation domain-containing protein [Pantoea formicae]MDF7650506.1 prepilin-type N-terminal cleavage/methylation domain-containing protein [Erwiniaceae bacterium L1_54_3]NIF02839.1 prepilin-type N-terminal cleavage/methylation domain-containing protein [Pantoea formicae]
MKKHPNAGFTLPELLCVMVIAGILSLGALQSWQRWQQHQQLRDSVQQLQGFLLRLRAHANWHNSDLNLWFIPGGSGCLGVGSKPPEGCLLSSRWWFKPPHNGVRLTGLIGEPGFYGRRDVARPGSVNMESDAGQWRLIISARARIRACPLGEKGCE